MKNIKYILKADISHGYPKVCVEREFGRKGDANFFDVNFIKGNIFGEDFVDIQQVHHHDFYGMWLVLEGSGTFIQDGEQYPITDNTLVFAAPGVPHRADNLVVTKAVTLVFSEDMLPWEYDTMADEIKDNLFQKVVTLKLSEESKARYLYDLVQRLKEKKETEETIYANQLSTRLLLQHLLCEIMSCADYLAMVGNFTKQESGLYKSFMQLVNEHYKEWHQVQDYLQAMNVSRKTLSTHASVSMKPHEIIDRRIILEAQRLLIHTCIPVNNIAMLLGFKDLSYFNRFFRKYCGISPTEYRAKKLVIDD